MRKSRADTAETRKRIVAAATHVFLRQGIGATGVADVMAAAGLTQGGFYRHFESKEQLLAEASTAAFHDLHAMFDAATAGKPPQEALDLILARYLYQLQGEETIYLCPLATLGSELPRADAQVKAAAAEGYAGLVKLFASLLMRMDIVDYLGLAEAIVATIVGAVSLSRLGADTAAAQAILANAENAVRLLVRNATTSKTLLKA
jgi:TetR/AcrR family transcriptional repressor of nem operon